MKNKKALLIIIVLTILLAFFVIAVWFSSSFAPGSTPYAEQYNLNYSEEKVKQAITSFKEENPDYLVPKVSINGQDSIDLLDANMPKSGRYYMYFYYKEGNQIFGIWLGGGEQNTIIALIAVNKGLTLGNWRKINKDFDDDENEKQKKLFEERILNKIKQALKDKN